MSPRHSVWPCLHSTPSSAVRLWFVSYVICLRVADATYLPIMLNRKSTLSDTLAMAGKTSFLRQSRASGHLDMMCTSTGTLVSASPCSSRQVNVRASQNKLNSNTTAAIWSRVFLVLRDAMVSSGGGAFISTCEFGRRGAFSSIAWDGIGADCSFM
jgi:hypothetical protein